MRPERRGVPGRRRRPLAAMSALTVAMTACTTLSTPRQAPPPPAPPPPVNQAMTQAAVLAGYFEVLQHLVQGQPAEQAQILNTARKDFEQAPTPSHQLRYALVLSTPDHPGTDPVKAQQLLRQLTMQESLLPAERAIAFLQLQSLEHTLALITENERLQGLADHTDEHDKYLAASKHLQAELDENVRLHKELDAARAKLDAIANIERAVNKPKPRPQGSAP